MITFFVPGVPVPKGSGRAFYNKKKGVSYVVQDNAARQKPWASLISYTAQETGCKVSDQGIALTLFFQMPRPKAHYGTGKNRGVLKTWAPLYHTSTPDLDKLIRCVKDALKGIVYKDDSQVCKLEQVTKCYVHGDEIPGVDIKIRIIEP